MVSSYTTISAIDKFVTTLKVWAVLIAAFAVGVAFIRLLQFEIPRIQRKEKDWYWSIWMIIMVVAVFIFGIIPPMQTHITWNFILVNVITVMDGTMWSLGGLAIIAGGLRATRVRSLESLIMMLVVISVVLYSMPGLPVWVPTIYSQGYWTYSFLGRAGVRGMMIAEAFGIIGLTVRIMLGREPGYFK
jgi:hypothetical protein